MLSEESALLSSLFGILPQDTHSGNGVTSGIHVQNISKRNKVSSEILLNFQRKRVKISITYECDFEIVKICQKYANVQKRCRKVAQNRGKKVKVARFKLSEQPGTFKCARARCKSCPFIRNVEKISGPKRSIKITDHFTCTSANVIYCITCSFCKKLYIGETERRLGDRFREHLRNVEKDDQNASKPVARHFKDVRANCHCSSLLRTQIHATSSISARALSTKINNGRQPLLQLRLDITILDVR